MIRVRIRTPPGQPPEQAAWPRGKRAARRCDCGGSSRTSPVLVGGSLLSCFLVFVVLPFVVFFLVGLLRLLHVAGAVESRGPRRHVVRSLRDRLAGFALAFNPLAFGFGREAAAF